MKVKLATIIIAVLVIISSTFLFIVLSNKPKVDIWEETDLEIDIHVSVKNLGQAQALDIPLRLALPVDHERSQRLEDVKFSVEPERFSNDTWGNEFAHFTIPQLGPAERFNVTLTVKFTLNSIDFSVLDSDSGVGEKNMSKYLSSSSLINLDEPDIIILARKIARDSDNLADIAWNTYEWIVDNIYYQQIAGEWDAATTLKNKEGGSAELANLFVALMRANGIPARRMSGWGARYREGLELQLTRFAHGWAEFYLEDFGWVPADPAWGQSRKFDNFAKADKRHVVLTRGAGIHFMTRGAYRDPYGETEVNTDYSIKVWEFHSNNLSLKRELIVDIVSAGPVILAAFIVIKKATQRRV